MRIELLQAWPRRFESMTVELPAGATLADALAAAGWSEAEGICAYAVFGVKAALDKPLDEGDRVELLRPLQLDPKEARRRRASRPVR